MASVCQPNFIPIFYNIFKECAYDSMDGLSIILGYISICFWINVLFPQLWENYCRKSVESLSYSFLTIWFLGDSTNLVGGILTDQLPFQIYLAAYFVLMDILTVIQCIYYNYFYNKDSHPRYNNHQGCPTLLRSLIPRRIVYNNAMKRNVILGVGLSFITLTVIYFQFYDLSPLPNIPPVILLQITNKASYNIGVIISWTCTFLYVLSRFPQIVKNFKRKSVEGLSLNLFLFAFFGNLTYSLSIILRAKFQLELLYPSLPFIIGSAGTMWADGILFYQFILYSRSNVTNSIETERMLNQIEDGKTDETPKPWNIANKNTLINEHNVNSFFSDDSSYKPSFSSDTNLASTPIQLKIHTTNPNYQSTP
ncbi:PQ-loop-domain-containing protein [Neoconidiobolus thromboides FSU 785]|nr:PQ-loop-domain-containing protein [Neoconidiobolus thromboides FSU 785]